MSPDEIKHFLLTHDARTGETAVRRFGTDYDRAQKAYAEAEREHRDQGDFDIVLVGADSLATIKQTHSSYFRSSEELGKELLSA